MDELEVNEIFNTIYDMYIIQLAFSNLTAINIVNNIIQKTMEGFILNCINIVVICLNTLYNKYRFDMIDRRFEKIEFDVSELKSDVSELKSDVSELKTKMNNMENMMKLLLEHNGIEFNKSDTS